MNNLIEFITVVRNDQVGLANTIDSMDKAFLHSNEVTKISHLIIDGASTDGTIEYLSQAIKNREINTRLISEPDKGIYDAMNKGIKNSKGDTLVFLNAGDLLFEEIDIQCLLNSVQNMLEKKNVAITAFSALLCFPNKLIKVNSRQVSKLSPRLPSIHQSLLYKSSIIKNNVYDTSFEVCGDYEQFCRLYSKGYEVIINKMPLAKFYSGGVSTLRPYLLFKESIYVSEKYFKVSFVRKGINRIKLVISLVTFSILHKAFK